MHLAIKDENINNFILSFMIIEIIIGAAALVIGGVGGYLVFRYVLTGKYNEMMDKILCSLLG